MVKPPYRSLSRAEGSIEGRSTRIDFPGLGKNSEGLVWPKKKQSLLSRDRKGGERPQKSPSSPSATEIPKSPASAPRLLAMRKLCFPKEKGSQSPRPFLGQRLEPLLEEEESHLTHRKQKLTVEREQPRSPVRSAMPPLRPWTLELIFIS
jgi:hypothetical protein